MNYLIVFAHPKRDSFSGAILDRCVSYLEGHGNAVEVRDLYALGFDPVLKADEVAGDKAAAADVADEQELIKWAHVHVYIYPCWWTGLPAILKGYIDRVLALNFAYASTETGPIGLLKDQKVIIFTPHGLPEEVYSPGGYYEAFRITQDVGIFEFCGMEVIAHRYFAGVTSVADEVRDSYLDGIEEVLEKSILVN